MGPLSIHPRIELEIDGYNRAMHGSLHDRRRSDQMHLGQGQRCVCEKADKSECYSDNSSP